LRDKLNTPIPEMPDGQAVVNVELWGSKAVVLVVGPVKGDSKAYASQIEAWRSQVGLKGDVFYSSENDCAAAAFEYATTAMWKTEASNSIELRSLFESLSAIEPTVYLTVIARPGVQTDFQIPPTATSERGTKVWKFASANLAPQQVTSRIVAKPSDPILAMIWLIFMPVVSWIIAPLAWLASVKWGSNAVEKRQKYNKIVMYGVFGAIGLHAVASIIVIPTRMFDAITQIWFGTRFSSIAIPAVMLGLPVGIAPLLLLTKWEKKLFAPTEAEAVEKPIESVLPEQDRIEQKRKTKRTLWLRGACFLIGIPFFFISNFVHKSHPLHDFGLMIGMLCVLVLPIPFEAWWQRREKNQASAESEQIAGLRTRFEGRLAYVNQKMGTTLSGEMSTERLMAQTAALDMKHRVIVGADLVNALSDDELDFIIGHEIAHKVVSPRRLWVHFWPLAFAPFVLIPIALDVPWAGQAMRSFMFGMLLIMPIQLWTMVRYRRNIELKCDAKSVTVLGNKEAAKSALRRITLGSEMPGLHTVDTPTHPALQKRLDAIDALDLT
jgi:Zn-dependent protease with chaperone function